MILTTFLPPMLDVQVPITRAIFIADNHVEIAISKLETIYMVKEGLEVVPMPQSIKESGVLPDGYCVDFILDPIVVVHALAEAGIRYERSISNGRGNLSIIPVKLWQEKQQLTIESLGHVEPPSSTQNKENCPPKRTRTSR